MAKLTSISTNIDSELKKALTTFCKKKGLKIQSFIEAAIVEQLEDLVDIEAYHSRKDEETIPLEELLKKYK
jgi:hypothetical protein